MVLEFKLPELGENISGGTVARILVAAGETVSEGQSLIEIETDKAVAEIPSSAAGTVGEIRVKEGQKINVGDVVLTLDTAAASNSPKAPPKLQVIERAAAPERPAAAVPGATTPKATTTVQRSATLAAPSVRRLARELGVDITHVPTADPTGRITAEDVRRFAETGNAPAPSATPATAAQATASPLQAGRWGPESREAMNTIRSKTAERMAANWISIPHVTQHDKADVTGIEALRKKYGPQIDAAGGKLTVTAILVKVIAEALKRFPKFNASIDIERQEVIYKHYYNVGVATDTEYGLLVPVLRDADKKSVTQVSIELPQLAAKARARKLALDEMQGGTFTISNLGGIGGTGFTPIINAPEVAILGVSRSNMEPVCANGQFAPRLMMPLSLSYDHRLIDGADAARFLRWVAEAIEQPWMLFLEA